jgi:hypothetical protein
MSAPVPNMAQYGPSLFAFAFVSVIIFVLNYPFDREFLEVDQSGRWLSNFILRAIFFSMMFINWMIGMYYLSRSFYDLSGVTGESKYIQATTAGDGNYSYDATTYNDIASNMGLISTFFTVTTLIVGIITFVGLGSHARLMRDDEGTLSRSQRRSRDKALADLYSRRIRGPVFADRMRAKMDAYESDNYKNENPEEWNVWNRWVNRTGLAAAKTVAVAGELVADVPRLAANATAVVTNSGLDAVARAAPGVAEALKVTKNRLTESQTAEFMRKLGSTASASAFGLKNKVLRDGVFSHVTYSALTNAVIFFLYIGLILMQIIYENNLLRPNTAEQVQPTTNYYYASMVGAACLAFVFALAAFGQLWQLIWGKEKDNYTVFMDPQIFDAGVGHRVEDQMSLKEDAKINSTLISTEADTLTEDSKVAMKWMGCSTGLIKQSVTTTDVVVSGHLPSGFVHDLIFSFRSGSLYLPPLGQMMQLAVVVNDFYYVNLMYLCAQQQLTWLMVCVGIPLIFAAEQFDSRAFMHPYFIASAMFWQSCFCWFSFNITSIQDGAAKNMFGDQDSDNGYRFFLTDFYDPDLGCYSSLRVNLMDQMSSWLLALAIFRAVISIVVVLYGLANAMQWIRKRNQMRFTLVGNSVFE